MADAASTMPTAAQLLALGLGRGRPRPVAGTLMPNTAADGEHATASTSTPWLPADVDARRPGHGGHEADEPDRNDSLRVGLDQLGVGRDDRRHEARLATW